MITQPLPLPSHELQAATSGGAVTSHPDTAPGPSFTDLMAAGPAPAKAPSRATDPAPTKAASDNNASGKKDSNKNDGKDQDDTNAAAALMTMTLPMIFSQLAAASASNGNRPATAVASTGTSATPGDASTGGTAAAAAATPSPDSKAAGKTAAAPAGTALLNARIATSAFMLLSQPKASAVEMPNGTQPAPTTSAVSTASANAPAVQEKSSGKPASAISALPGAAELNARVSTSTAGLMSRPSVTLTNVPHAATQTISPSIASATATPSNGAGKGTSSPHTDAVAQKTLAVPAPTSSNSPPNAAPPATSQLVAQAAFNTQSGRPTHSTEPLEGAAQSGTAVAGGNSAPNSRGITAANAKPMPAEPANPSTGHGSFSEALTKSSDENASAQTPSHVDPNSAGGNLPLGTANNTQAPNANAPATPDQAPRPPMLPHGAAEQVAVNLKQAVKSGLDQIKIQLKPESLGTIDVKLNVSHDGHVMAVISADRSDTLNMLQRDSSGLQQALRDAGLQTNGGSLSFNLRGDGGQSYSQNTPQQSSTPRYSARTPAEPIASIAAPALRRHIGSLDLHI